MHFIFIHGILYLYQTNHDAILSSNDVILVAPSLLANGNTDYSGLTFEMPDSSAAQAARATSGRTGTDTPTKKGGWVMDDYLTLTDEAD